MTRLVQLQDGARRAVALVEEPHLRLIAGAETVYALAVEAAETRTNLAALVRGRAIGERLEYDHIDAGLSAWRVVVPIDHPVDPARCLVTGTGLTHLGSAKNRNAMHGTAAADLTDSMKMFRAGLDGGRPEAGRAGAAPEWFYKGSGTILRGPGEALVVPSYALDGGEEAEVAGIYVIDAAGQPRRIGMAAGNEFSDHRFEKTNYLNLAGSKLRTCALGPELALDRDFQSVSGTVSIERKGQVLWRKEIATGEHEMCHSLANIEHHHFKFDAHRRPGDVHVHYFGAHSLSFGDGLTMANDDVMVIQFDGFGRPLRNSVRIEPPSRAMISVEPLS